MRAYEEMRCRMAARPTCFHVGLILAIESREIRHSDHAADGDHDQLPRAIDQFGGQADLHPGDLHGEKRRGEP